MGWEGLAAPGRGRWVDSLQHRTDVVREENYTEERRTASWMNSGSALAVNVRTMGSRPEGCSYLPSPDLASSMHASVPGYLLCTRD